MPPPCSPTLKRACRSSWSRTTAPLRVTATLPPLVAQLGPRDELVVVDNDSARRDARGRPRAGPRGRRAPDRAQRRLRGGRERGRGRGERRAAAVPQPRRASGARVRRGDRRAAARRPRLGGVDGAGDGGGRARGEHERRRGALHRDRVGRRGGRAGARLAGRRARGGVPVRRLPRRPARGVGARRRLRRASYFMYFEDVDLSLRLRLAGGRLGVEPSAVVDHDYAFAKGPEKWRLLERNRWATIVRCYPGPLLIAIAPALLATELALLVVAAAGGWLPQKLRGTAEALLRLPRLLRERRAIQATRTIPAAEFARWLTPDLDSAYLGRAGRLRAVALGAPGVLARGAVDRRRTAATVSGHGPLARSARRRRRARGRHRRRRRRLPVRLAQHGPADGGARGAAGGLHRRPPRARGRQLHRRPPSDVRRRGLRARGRGDRARR